MKPNALLLTLAMAAALQAAAPAIAGPLYDAPAPTPLGIAAGTGTLAVALATIVPNQYRTVLEKPVAPGQPVTWPAGRDWLAVLSATLKPVGLAARPHWAASTVQIVLVNPALAFHPMPTPAVTTRSADSEPSGPDEFTGPGWDSPAPPAPKAPTALIDAILRLTPPQQTDARLAVLGIDTSEPVTWSADQTRESALREVLRSKGLHLAMHGTDMRVTVAAQRHMQGRAPAQQVTKATAPGTPTAKAVPPLARPVKAAMPAAVVVKPAPVWQIHAGEDVAAAIQAWGEKAGWVVAWDAPEVHVAPLHTTQFSGTFLQAVSAAVNALHANGADIAADIHDNSTIVVHPGGAK